MSDDKWITVDPKSNKLAIRFRVKGFDKQFYLSTGLEDNENNRIKVRSLRNIIENDIFLGDFDPTLSRYLKFKNQKAKPEYKPKTPTIKLLELWDRYSSYQGQHLELSTMYNYDYIKKIIDKLPTDDLSKSSEIRDYLLENYSYYTAWMCVAAFYRCCDWAVNSNLIVINNFEKIKLAKPKKTKHKIKAFTLEQRDLIIHSFEQHSKFSYCAPIIKFLFWTGCRPGEAFALTWGDVSPDCLHVHINKSFASTVKILKGTKNGKERTFSTENGSKLNLLLQSIRPQKPDPQALIFTTKEGARLNLSSLDKCWRGFQVKNYDYPGVVRELAEAGKVPLLNPYSTRHTFATWAIASNISPDQVAYWLGDNLATVLKYYCHPEVSKNSCPDF
ncbi:MAG TPA: tyrosine-type recombinase/integrase [Nostocaceae cyanobacterium]|nr:tyrosine-type recombinase/integrase [Nostocaceae cyanobacterium]